LQSIIPPEVGRYMTGRLILFLLTCGPFVLTLYAWIKVRQERQRPRAVALMALGIVTANAALAAGTFLRYQFRSSVRPPPWENPQVLTFGMLFLLAPIGMIVGLVAALRGCPKWLICIVEIASVPLLMVGFLAVGAV
jgi:hypothetical protein